MQKKILIEKMIRCRGINKQHVLQSLNITRPTLIKLLQDVNLLNGHQRNRLADVLGIDVSIIDCIINTTDKDATELTMAVLNIIKPIQDGNR
jgi:plasmid maintenance system antidote protein VapI